MTEHSGCDSRHTVVTCPLPMKSIAAACRRHERRLVFAAFAGESWDYMGSKRFLWELHSGSAATAGLSLERIDQAPSCRLACACFSGTCARCVAAS